MIKEKYIDDFEQFSIEAYYTGGLMYGCKECQEKRWIDFSSEIFHSGSKSLKISFDTHTWDRVMNGTVNIFVRVERQHGQSDEIKEAYSTDIYPKKFCLWVHGDGKTPWLRASFLSGGNQRKTLNLTSETTGVNWVGWKYLEVDIPEGWELPIQLDYIYAVETNKEIPDYQATFYLDELKFLYCEQTEDLSGPEFCEITPKPGLIYRDRIYFSAKLQDNRSGVDEDRIRVYVNGAEAPFVFENRKLQMKLEGLEEKEYHVVAEAYDKAGNPSRPGIDVTYKVDLSPDLEPPKLVHFMPDGQTVIRTDRPKISFRISDEKSGISKIDIKLDGNPIQFYYDKANGWGYGILEYPLENGSHCFTIDAEDKAGNCMKTEIKKFQIDAIGADFDEIVIVPDTHGSKYLESILKQAGPRNLVICLGDLVDDGSEEQFQKAYQKIAPYQKNMMVLPGNHEAFRGNLDLFRHYFGCLSQHMLWGNTLIVLLHSAIRQSITESDPTQFHYLRRLLEIYDGMNLLAVTHVPLKDSFDTGHQMDVSDAHEIENILEQYKKKNSHLKVTMLSGHLHTLQEWEKNSVKYIVCGNAADKGYTLHKEGNLLGYGVLGRDLIYSFHPYLKGLMLQHDKIRNGGLILYPGEKIHLDLLGDFGDYLQKLNDFPMIKVLWKALDQQLLKIDQTGNMQAITQGKTELCVICGGKKTIMQVEIK